MPDHELDSFPMSVRGSRDSLIEKFTIAGLYGYRTVSLSSQYAATVIIAKNGAGKTTLIGVLDAFLKGQLSRLRDLDFSEIRCKLRGINEELSLTRDDIIEFSDIGPDSEVAKYSRRIEVDPQVLFHFLTEDFWLNRSNIRLLRDDSTFSAIYRLSNYRSNETIATCERLRLSLLGKNDRIQRIRSALDQTFSQIEIVYLPTYRRIESPLVSDETSDRPHRKKSSRSASRPGHLREIYNLA